MQMPVRRSTCGVQTFRNFSCRLLGCLYRAPPRALYWTVSRWAAEAGTRSVAALTGLSDWYNREQASVPQL